MNLQHLLGIECPLIQAPMAGVQDSRLALAVCEAGGLGSLPCALLSLDALRAELNSLRAGTDRPYNLNFFCHTPPAPDAAREARWRAALAPYYRELGLDPAAIPQGPGRAPFSPEAAALLSEFQPRVVSFHFGLPSAELLAQVRGWGAKVIASATTLAEGLWPLNAVAPAFPQATGAIAPLRARAESQGSGDFSPLWCGQNTSGCREIGAALLTRQLAQGFD